MTINSSIETLLENLRALYQTLRTETRAKWKRDLPLVEMLFDRWERAQSLGFGERTSIYQNSYVFGDVRVGENTWIGPFTLLDGSGGLTIGDNCSISSGVQIYTHDTVKWAVSGGVAKYEYAPVKIGDSCYIGAQTVIAKGVTIGEHSIVGACSFVNKPIPSYSVVAGVPSRVIGRVQLDADGNVSWQID